MNYYDARQHATTRRWHYTCRNGRDIWPVGRCAEDGGHAVEAEARDCYRASLIAAAKFEKIGGEEDCAVTKCGKPAEKVTGVMTRVYYLCKEHASAKGLELVVPAVGTIVSSY